MLNDEVKKLMEKLTTEFEQFKTENDRRLKEVELKGRADPLTEEKINKHSSAIGALEKSINELVAKLNRPGAGVGQAATEEQAEHRKLFAKYMKKGQDAGLADLQQKLLQIGVDGDGGYAVPEELDRNIGRMETDAMPMEGLVSSLTMGGESYEKLYDLEGATSGWVGETDDRPETDTPEVGSFKPVYGELYANPFATQKMLDDAFFDVEAWLTESVARKFAEDLDAAIVSGNGVVKPKGILAYSLAATADATRAWGVIEKMHSGGAGTLTADNLIDLTLKLKPGYRQNAKWLMASATVGYIRKLKDANDQYLWQPSIQAGQPSVLLGHALVEDENVPAMASGAHSVIFGDYKRAYKLINIKGIRVLRDPYTAKPKVGFYTTKRVGGGVEDTSALKVLTLSV